MAIRILTCENPGDTATGTTSIVPATWHKGATTIHTPDPKAGGVLIANIS